MRYNNDSSTDFPGKLRKFFIALLNLFIKRLVLNFKLLKINEMKSISELLLLLEDLLTVSQLILKLNVLQSVLMHFRVLSLISCFPIIDHFCAQRLVGTAEYRVLGYRTFQFLKLMLDFLTLSLFFIELGLKFGSHSVVTLLGLLKVETDLMDVSESVKIFVFIKQLILLFSLVVTLIEFVFNDPLLKLSVSFLKTLVFPEFILDSADEFISDFAFFR